jgi:hypothetical protein
VGQRADRDTQRRHQKKQVRKPRSKARLRREFEAVLERVRTLLRRFPRLAAAEERELVLRRALVDLDLLLEEKPQSQVLKHQKRSCLEALQELSRNPGPIAPDLRLVLENPDARRLALKARIHPPGSDVKSWN